MEYVIYHSVMEHLQQNEILNEFQYGFRQGYSSEAQLVSVVEDISHNLYQKKQDVATVQGLNFSAGKPRSTLSLFTNTQK